MTSRKKKPAAKEPSHPLMLNGKNWDREKVMDIVCNAIASSSRSVATILGNGHNGHTLPDYATFARWIAEEADGENPLAVRYRMAKEAQADYMAEELAELHNKAWIPMTNQEGDLLYDMDGNILMTVNKSSAAVVRLEADNKKWLMGKLKPKRYGDKVTQEIAPTDGFTKFLHGISHSARSAFTPVPDDSLPPP